MHTLKKFSAALRAAKFFYIFFRRASRGAAWPLHFKFASYAYVMVYTVNALLLLISAFFIMLYVFCKLTLTNIQNIAQCQGFMRDCKQTEVCLLQP